jgi:hypothetical protein
MPAEDSQNLSEAFLLRSVRSSNERPSLKLTMDMPKATRGLACIFGMELKLRMGKAEDSRDSGIHLSPRLGFFFFWHRATGFVKDSGLRLNPGAG